MCVWGTPFPWGCSAKPLVTLTSALCKLAWSHHLLCPQPILTLYLLLSFKKTQFLSEPDSFPTGHVHTRVQLPPPGREDSSKTDNDSTAIFTAANTGEFSSLLALCLLPHPLLAFYVPHFRGLSPEQNTDGGGANASATHLSSLRMCTCMYVC